MGRTSQSPKLSPNEQQQPIGPSQLAHWICLTGPAPVLSYRSDLSGESPTRCPLGMNGRRLRKPRLSDRAAAYGFEGKTVDGNDLEAVYAAAESAAKKARSGGGATFLECLTYRWDGHFGGDPGTGYRPKEEIEAWKLKCPIKRLSEKLIEAGQLSAEEFHRLNETVYAEVDAVAKRAEAAPLPNKEVDLTSIFASAEVTNG